MHGWDPYARSDTERVRPVTLDGSIREPMAPPSAGTPVPGPQVPPDLAGPHVRNSTAVKALDRRSPRCGSSRPNPQCNRTANGTERPEGPARGTRQAGGDHAEGTHPAQTPQPQCRRPAIGYDTTSPTAFTTESSRSQKMSLWSPFRPPDSTEQAPVSQVSFIGPDGMRVQWDVSEPGRLDRARAADLSRAAQLPARAHLSPETDQSAGQPWRGTYPTMEVAPTAQRSEEFLRARGWAIPIPHSPKRISTRFELR